MTWEQTLQDLAPPRLIGTPVEQFKQMLKRYAGERWKPYLEEIILQNFEIQADNTIRPHLSFERHMKILRALWEQRPAELYPRIQCPALLIPAMMETDENQEWLKYHRSRVEIAGGGIKDNRIVWFNDTVHDIPLQRPRKLANAISRFALDYKLIKTAKLHRSRKINNTGRSW